ncbi:MAG: hypothetical protein LBT00_05470 [Spirochaetaceae bacterium]|nr:hypothetical protein [Spirochaetaceae bacterium]
MENGKWRMSFLRGAGRASSLRGVGRASSLRTRRVKQSSALREWIMENCKWKMRGVWRLLAPLWENG